jgi:uncharacterized phage protein (TIGR02220 family)
LWKEKPYDKARAWVDILLLANHEDNKCLIGGELKVIERGQLATTITTLANRWGWNRKTVSSFLNVLSADNMITQERTKRGITVTVENYGIYQDYGTTERTTDGQPNGHSRDNHGTFTGHSRDIHGTFTGQPMDNHGTHNNNVNNVNNNNNVNNDNNVNNGNNENKENKKSYIAETAEIIDYLNMVCGTHYKSTTEKTKSFIRARLNEGFTVEDFKTVIDKKSREWITDAKMSKFLRPETLFGTKFEQYLNQLDAEPTAGAFGEPKRGADGLTDWERMWKNA